jgi:hypothetical protein
MVELMCGLLEAPSPCPLPQGEGLIAAVVQVQVLHGYSVRALVSQSHKSLAPTTSLRITEQFTALLNLGKHFFPSPSGRGQGEGALKC